MKFAKSGWALFALLTLGLSAPLAAQTGILSGRVTDASSGSGVGFAQVVVVSASGAAVGSVTTDETGNFRVGNIPAGTYRVAVTRIGYVPGEQTGVAIPGSVTIALTKVTLLDAVAVTHNRGTTGEKVLDAPASIAVVGAERIAERPSITVADHLKAVPGLSVSSGGIAQANISSRGFNNAFSTAMLMLQDYRFASVPSLRVNIPFLFTGTNEDIERIEVLNGPASALYGPNSGNGVLHVITKSPLSWQGTTLTLDGGTNELLRLSGRHSTKLGDRLGVKLSGEYARAVDFKYDDPNEPDVFPSIAPEGRRGEAVVPDFALERMSGELRADYRFSEHTELISTAGFSKMGSALEVTTVFGRVQAKDWTYFNFQERFRHKDFFAQVFYNGSNSGNEGGSDLNGSHFLRTGLPVVDKSTVLVGQVQQGFSLGQFPMIAGFDYIKTTPVTEGTINGRNEDDDEVTEMGAYLQGTFRLTDKLDFVAAARGDKNDRLDGNQFSPRAALVFKAAPTHNFRATFNRAFNSPANFTFFLDQLQDPQRAPGFALRAIGNPALEGWNFDRSCEQSVNNGLCMRSPYTGTNNTFDSDATVAYPGFINSLDEIVQALPTLTAEQRAGLLGILNHPLFGPTLRGLNPTSADVGTVLRLGSAAVDPNSVRDIGALKASFNNTFELGYKGIIGSKTRIAIDLWHQIRAETGLPAAQANPGVFYDPATLGTYLVTNLTVALMQQGVPQQQAQATATEVAGALVPLMAQLPQGSITIDSPLTADQSFIATYAQGNGEISVNGVDLALEYLLTDRWSLEGTYSFIDKIVFPEVGGAQNPLMSNSPKHRATAAGRYKHEGMGLGLETRVRYSDAFPVNSGVFNSLGIPPNTPGTALYTRPGTSIQFDIGVMKRLSLAGREFNWSLFGQNIADDESPTFVGVPAVGRLITTRIQYTF